MQGVDWGNVAGFYSLEQVEQKNEMNIAPD